jgi:coenzyme Q-binding protein COQ10
VPTHAEIKIVPYTAEQMYDLIADVERYPEFLPWCIACRIRERKEELLVADLVVGYKIFRESFTSQVHLHPHNRIDVNYQQGPLRYLNNHWKFKNLGDGTCELDFYVDFAFNNHFFQSAIEMFFNEAVRVMIRSFEKRAGDLYGKKHAASV